MPASLHKTWVSLILLSVASALTAQDVRLRSSVELVVVPVSVEDKSGRSVTNLSESDFTVLEDGKKQSIASFSIDPVPISAAVLIDTGLSEGSFDKIKNSFPALSGAFADEDEVAVYRFDRYVVKLMEFSNDRNAVEATLEKLRDVTALPSPVVSGPFSNPGPVINGIPVIPGVQAATRTAPPQTKVLNDAIFQASEDLMLREKDHRKVILVISDGENKGNDHSFDSTLDRLLDRGIQVYAVGMDRAFLSRGRSSLGSYAAQSGGASCFLNSQNALEMCYSRSTEKARNQYILGYVSSQRPRGSKSVFRKIDIRVSQKGLEPHHKKGYYQAP